MLYDLESHAKDGRCGLSRNEYIRRYLGKLVEKNKLLSSRNLFHQYLQSTIMVNSQTTSIPTCVLERMDSTDTKMYCNIDDHQTIIISNSLSGECTTDY